MIKLKGLKKRKVPDLEPLRVLITARMAGLEAEYEGLQGILDKLNGVVGGGESEESEEDEYGSSPTYIEDANYAELKGSRGGVVAGTSAYPDPQSTQRDFQFQPPLPMVEGLSAANAALAQILASQRNGGIGFYGDKAQ